jgi:hypothetical protein
MAIDESLQGTIAAAAARGRLSFACKQRHALHWDLKLKLLLLSLSRMMICLASSSAQSLLTAAVQCCCWLAKLDFIFTLKTCSPYARPPPPLYVQ